MCFIWIECLSAGHVWLVCAFDFSVPLNGFMVGHKQREEETYTDRASVVARGAFQNKPEAKEEVRYRSVCKWSGGQQRSRSWKECNGSKAQPVDEQAEATITLSKESIFVLWTIRRSDEWPSFIFRITSLSKRLKPHSKFLLFNCNFNYFPNITKISSFCNPGALSAPVLVVVNKKYNKIPCQNRSLLRTSAETDCMRRPTRHEKPQVINLGVLTEKW